MRVCKVQLVPPRRSGILQPVPGQPNGIAQVGIDIDAIASVITEVGHRNFITMLPLMPAGFFIFYWADVVDSATGQT